MKNQFSDFIFRVMTYIIYNLRVTHRDFQVCHQLKKKSFKSSQIYRKEAQWVDERKIYFAIFIFWVMVDFVLKIDRKIDQFWVQKRPYLKN